MPTTLTIPVTVEVPDLRPRPKKNGALIHPIDPDTIGDLLLKARALRGWTQGQAGLQSQERFGFAISKSSISAWEDGDNVPSLSAFESLVAVYDPPGGRDWFAPAYCPELREALGMHMLPNVADPWSES